MSLHLQAGRGDYAAGIVLPGDPLRARHLATGMLEGAQCVNERRAAYGFTGTYRGRRVSVQSTGMGMPSMAIYAHELIVDYGVRCLVRLGTCGSLQPGLRIGDLVLASAASTDSSMNRQVFGGAEFAPAADFALLRDAHALALERGLPVRVGTVVTSDVFYAPETALRVWAEHGVLAAEMETSALYTLAARHRVAALSVLTISDVIGTAEVMPPEDRERALVPAAELAFELAARASES